jgi:hypothetical protein
LRIRFLKPLSALSLLLLFLLTTSLAEPPSPELVAMFPQSVGEFRSNGPSPVNSLWKEIKPEDYGVRLSGEAVYVSPKGGRYTVIVVKTASDSGAYALLTRAAEQLRSELKSETAINGEVGIASLSSSRRVDFFKGATFVRVAETTTRSDENGLKEFARLFAETLDKGEGEIPVLVKHLPEWETAQQRASYVVSLPALQAAAGQRPVLDAVSFEGGAEAITATYGPSRLVIIENNTPQLATTNDARINAKLKELREGGQPVPTAYRRVGNYSVFVFDAPDEATAVKLIEGIKYEQVVQWLGPNPYDYQRAVRKYTDTTAGVIVAVLKASGLSLLLCLGVGAIFGGLVFKRRRQQQQAITQGFSDAGGMVRLNLDEMTQMEATGKLLGPGEGR